MTRGYLIACGAGATFDAEVAIPPGFDRIVEVSSNLSNVSLVLKELGRELTLANMTVGIPVPVGVTIDPRRPHTLRAKGTQPGLVALILTVFVSTPLNEDC